MQTIKEKLRVTFHPRQTVFGKIKLKSSRFSLKGTFFSEKKNIKRLSLRLAIKRRARKIAMRGKCGKFFTATDVQFKAARIVFALAF